MSMSTDQIALVNRRVVINGSKGVVKYLGPVNGTSGIWVGIDWDDPKRGKHDGGLNGRRYFTASTPSSGSFVREHSLDFGTEIFGAILAKYAEYDEDHGSQESGIERDQKDDGIKWELVRMDKIHGMQKDVYRLRCIVLSWSLVSHLDLRKIERQHQKFSQCTELDLTETLVGKWSQISDILKGFPALRILHLSDNRIEPLESCTEEERQSLKSELKDSQITHLSLNRCKLSEYTANLIPNFFAKLEELYLADNCLTSFAPSPTCDCARLRLLDLQRNPIRKMEQLQRIYPLPSLSYLNLSSTELSCLEFGPEFAGFASLKTLVLQDNPISQWSVVDELARLPALSKLILKGAPLPGARGVDSREMIIAKIPQIVDLDRCDVSPVARRSAELLFLSRFSTPPQDPAHQHTLQQLASIYEEKKDENGALSSNGFEPTSQIQSIGIQSRRVRLTHADKAEERRLSLALPIHKVVGLGARLFGFDPDQLKGVELRRADPNYPAELLPRTRDSLLRQFELDDGDVIAFV